MSPCPKFNANALQEVDVCWHFPCPFLLLLDAYGKGFTFQILLEGCAGPHSCRVYGVPQNPQTSFLLAFPFCPWH